MVVVAVEVCFAGGFPDYAGFEEFGLGGADKGVETAFPGCVAVGLTHVLECGLAGFYEIVEEGGAGEELAVVVCPFDLIEGLTSRDSRSNCSPIINGIITRQQS